MKTPEEILDQYLENYPWQYWAKENAIKAMNEYANQFLKEVNKNFEKHLAKLHAIEESDRNYTRIAGNLIEPINEWKNHE